MIVLGGRKRQGASIPNRPRQVGDQRSRGGLASFYRAARLDAWASRGSAGSVSGSGLDPAPARRATLGLRNAVSGMASAVKATAIQSAARNPETNVAGES